jgi:hypothetical protein
MLSIQLSYSHTYQENIPGHPYYLCVGELPWLPIKKKSLKKLFALHKEYEMIYAFTFDT